MSILKLCPKCNTQKPLDAFGPDKSRKDGLNRLCRPCALQSSKEWRERNREKERARHKEYRRRNPDADRLYYQKNKERILEQHRLYREVHREERYRTQSKYRRNNLHKYRKYQSAYYQRTPEVHKVYEREWRKANRRKRATTQQLRRARKANAEGEHTAEEFEALCKKHDYKCLACGQKTKLTADHIVPLSCGGSNDIGNIQPLCMKCNCSKGTKTIDYR